MELLTLPSAKFATLLPYNAYADALHRSQAMAKEVDAQCGTYTQQRLAKNGNTPSGRYRMTVSKKAMLIR